MAIPIKITNAQTLNPAVLLLEIYAKTHTWVKKIFLITKSGNNLKTNILDVWKKEKGDIYVCRYTKYL